MKKLLLSAVGLVAMASSASAADLAARPYTKVPSVAVTVYDWNGFYIGANGGWVRAANAGMP
jgi:outer membrane immunogenic protein